MLEHTALLPGTQLPHGGPFLGAHFSWEDLSLLTVPKASLLAGICPLRRDLESLVPMVEAVQVWTVSLRQSSVPVT